MQDDRIRGLAMELDSATLLRLQNSRLVTRVYEDYQLRSLLNQSVPSVGADLAWQSGFDGSGWHVVVIDSGVDKVHNFFKINNQPVVVVDEACFSFSENCPNSTTEEAGPGTGVHCNFSGATNACSHGTGMAGIVASRDATYKGVAPGAKIISIRVASPQTEDCKPLTGDTICIQFATSDIIKALTRVFLLRESFSIASVNLSLGTGEFSDQEQCDAFSPLTKEKIDGLRSVGIAVVGATGNESTSNNVKGLNFPACISSAVSVGATSKNLQTNTIWVGSNSGPFLSLVAPGMDVTSPFPGDLIATGSGTSNAAPHVAGAWAILKQKKSDATVGQILNALQTTGVKITDTRSGANNRVHCRIQVDDALDNIPVDAFTTLDIPESKASGINNCGEIVGTEYVNWTGFISDTLGSYAPIVYDGPLEDEGWVDATEATAINNKGEVHAWYCCGTFGDRSFLWNPSGQDVPTNYPNTYSTDVYGNNDAGDLAGHVAGATVYGGFKESLWYFL